MSVHSPAPRIAFVAQMRTGKDTAAEYLQRKLGGVIQRFSDPLYEILAAAQRIAGIPPHKDRGFLQWVGTSWARAQDQDLWVKHLVRRVAPLRCPVFVTDCRFENEVAALRREGFLIVFLRATRANQLGRGATEAELDADHVSERMAKTFTNYDIAIDNNGTLEEFYEQLDKLLG